jgi:hypothetical protein
MVTLIYLVALSFLFLQTFVTFHRGRLLAQDYKGKGGYLAYIQSPQAGQRFLGLNFLWTNWFIAAAVGHYLFG